ncbi:MAG: GTP cyclohydrolase 1 type 2 [Candidatus Woesearchaeota archaeon]|nr:GTP cyclohydrolase 1 type 2 [Candidatus Woesearchaeota archaeon]
MKAKQLYGKLEKDFIKPEMADVWIERMKPISKFLTKSFREREIGLVCDNTDNIEKVYTAVFASEKVMKELLEKNVKNALLFVHHPMGWQLDKAPDIFKNMDLNLLEKFKENNISIYCLHVPLDNVGEYGTPLTFANALDLKPVKEFAPYHGSMSGLFCSTDCSTLTELGKKFKKAVGHVVKVYDYGDKKINGKVALIPGGGFTEESDAIAQYGADVFVVGVTALTDYSKQAHEFFKKNRINLIGGTHYSTEKFSMIKMCEYFEKLGLKAEFVEDKPMMADL